MRVRPDSFPFLHLARRLCLPYADVLLTADYFDGQRNRHVLEAFARVMRNELAIDSIRDEVKWERDRRAAVSP
jgi:hypothetical protein